MIARLRELEWSCVMGNTDAWLIDSRPSDGSHQEPPESREIGRWCADQLDAADRADLASFEPTVSIPIDEDRSLLRYHGAPASFRTWILPTTPEHELDAHFEGWPAAVYAGGHRHEVMVRRHRQSMVVNPGSVGFPVQTEQNGKVRHPAWAESGLGPVDRAEVHVDLRRRAFHLPSLAAAARASGMPHSDGWIDQWDERRRSALATTAIYRWTNQSQNRP